MTRKELKIVLLALGVGALLILADALAATHANANPPGFKGFEEGKTYTISSLFCDTEAAAKDLLIADMTSEDAFHELLVKYNEEKDARGQSVCGGMTAGVVIGKQLAEFDGPQKSYLVVVIADGEPMFMLSHYPVLKPGEGI